MRNWTKVNSRPCKLLLALPLFLAACGEENTAVSYLAVNHTDKPIDSITINDQGGILNVDAMGGGGRTFAASLCQKPGVRG
ncbi:DUF3304 domain-containing protein [Chromobacterium amazonense]|uniref:hypothetical protein n=1 Tax=Chromobacterium amazonense TaxID=1382803 RepID=UPI0036F21734